MKEFYGPASALSDKTHRDKYRLQDEEFFYDTVCRVVGVLSDSEEHRRDIKMTCLDQAFMPGGRIQRAIGSPYDVTAINCYVSQTIEDSTDGIFDSLKRAFMTMRMGGGIGYDFSTLRYRGAIIKSQGQPASGAVSFMDPFDASCGTVASAGNRRGAQMGVLRVDHPDIEEFVTAKRGTGKLKNFNISVAVTDKFMDAVKNDEMFDLTFAGQVVKTIKATYLWDLIMRTTWDYADPGVIFIDRINDWNNLQYCETIAATNPCGEQPLPPNGACLLGSFNTVKYVKARNKKHFIDLEAFAADIPGVVRMMDNVIENTRYPLPEQEEEQRSKRRMGLGVTGMANAIEACGHLYGSEGYLKLQGKILRKLRDEAYRASIELAKEKGAFALFDKDRYLSSKFIQTLPQDIQDGIAEHGIRNSHLLSIAPTGTISLSADNISSGIEPVFMYEGLRTVIDDDGPRQFEVTDYGVEHFGVRGKLADQCTAQEHVRVLCEAQKYVDSAVSKTCNVGDEVTWEEFKDLYMQAYDNGAKGCTTFRASGKLMGILTKREEQVEEEGSACYVDPETGSKSCG